MTRVIDTASAAVVELPRVTAYREHLEASLDWLIRSERPGGGSSAFFLPVVGWSRPYPETTGYLVPTLLAAARQGHRHAGELAQRCGHWLLGIQNVDGSWHGGLHRPGSQGRPSIFNTGQILKGLIALQQATGDEVWNQAARRAQEWLLDSQNSQGLWDRVDYKGQGTPSYYSEVLAPMLAWARHENDRPAIDRCRRGVETILGRRRENGAIAAWGFSGADRGFTHTIAYTIRGIQDSARVLEDTALESAVTPAIDRLVRASELRGGRLAGSFDADWRPDDRYVCLTGNAQVALCILLLEGRTPDLRLVSAAAKMIDVICHAQRLRSTLAVPRGGVGGSWPLTGKYMRFRYPNWAAKYTVDALMALMSRVEHYRWPTVAASS